MAKRQARKHLSHPYSPTNSVSPTDGTPDATKRQQQDGLIQELEELTSGKPPTVIPFPSEVAPAAADRPDPQATRETQGDAGHASAAQRLWVSRARRKAAKKSRRKRDWDRFTFGNGREKFTPQERLEREKANYRREKLLSGKHTQLPAPAATIIPFPSEQAQAADGSDDPPGDT